MLMVPIGGHGAMNPFNGCSWTLVYEYASNLVYGLFLRRVGLRILSALTAAAGAITSRASVRPGLSSAVLRRNYRIR